MNRSPAHASLAKSVSENKIGVFKRKFTAREIEIFESVAGDALRIYGYETVSVCDRPARAAERLGFLLEDNVIRYVRKFGRPGIIKQDFEEAWQRGTRKFVRSWAKVVC